MSEIVYQRLRHPSELDAWEPRGGYALLTCKILIGVTWEPRTYEFIRSPQGIWTIDTNPGLLRRGSWEDVAAWFESMRPREIDLVTEI